MKLNQEQEQVVNHLDGSCLVVAVPGSGKTRVIVERMVKLIEKGIKADSILSITFTNKAADEMKNRICDRLKIDKFPGYIGTIHSFCVLLLRKFGSRIGYDSNFTILDSDEQKDVVLQVARGLGYEIDKAAAWQICTVINNYRENLETDEEVLYEKLKNNRFVEIALKYVEKIKKDNILDFSGLLSEAYHILATDKEALERTQNKFKYIQIDEVQDTNLCQFKMIELISDKYNNLVMVGDIDQSVYGWRGARVENIKDYLENHKTCKVLSLPLNYRSTPQIIKVADTLIKKNSNRLVADLRSNNDDGQDVGCVSFNNQYDEAYWVISQIQDLIQIYNYKPGDIAVLYRINRMSEPLEQELIRKNVPYQVIGSYNFYDKKEIKDCLGMIKFYVNPKDGIAFHRVCSLVSGLGDTSIGKIENLANSKNISIIEAMKEMRNDSKSTRFNNAIDKILNIYQGDFASLKVPDIINKFVDGFEYEKLLEKEYPEDHSDRVENIKQLIDSSAYFSDSGAGIDKYLQMITLLTSVDKKEDKSKVTLMTLHACKGLEFPIVFMVGVEQHILPHSMAVSERADGLEEERRLCYVGMTRAKNSLNLTYCKYRKTFTKDQGLIFKKSQPSQFLKESGLVDDWEYVK